MSIADRHMQPLLGMKDAGETRPLVVRVRASERAATSPSGQLTLTALVNLLARQVGAVAQIQLDVPKAAVLVRLPYDTHASDIAAAAAHFAPWVTKGQVEATPWDGREPADLVVLLGAQPSPFDPALVLACLGHGWRAWVGVPRPGVELDAWDAADPNPLGPFFAASVAAGEVFKLARQATLGTFAESFAYSLWSGEIADRLTDLADGPRLEGAALPPFYLVGAGAVGQGVAYILGSSPVSGNLILIDDDRHDETNLNRCFLAGADDETHVKVDCVERFLRGSSIRVRCFAKSLIEYLGDPHPDLPKPFANDEAVGRFDVVVSCVDKGTSRQTIQGMWPRLILGGSTDGFSAKANLYDLAAGSPCLGCHNPAEPEGDKIRLLERQMRPLTRAQRADFLKAKVDDLEAVLDYLEQDNPNCGTAAESQFRAAALSHAGEFSVGFVSLGAALLLVSSLLRRLVYMDLAPARTHMSLLHFLKVQPYDGVLGVNTACPRCSGPGRGRFFGIWSEGLA